jgi:hypothetical protein
MPTEHILSLLIQERDKLNRAIEALEGQNRPSGNSSTEGEAGTPKKKRFISAAVRGKMALAQKKRWAAAKPVAPKMSAAQIKSREEHSARMKTAWAKRKAAAQ